MIGGQVVDIEHEDTSIDRETLALLQKMKTGALIRAAARLGCIAAGHPRAGGSCRSVRSEPGPRLSNHR